MLPPRALLVPYVLSASAVVCTPPSQSGSSQDEKEQAPATTSEDPGAEHYWPQWRGPLATGVAPHADPPLEWSETENVRWKTPIPGKGHSTPVIWGERIFLTTAVPFGEPFEPRIDTAPGAHDGLAVTQKHRFEVLAVDRRDGEILWRRELREEIPHEGGYYTGSYASQSPVTDGEHLFVYFGSRGLFCLDLDGWVLWEKDLGQMQTKHAHGEGSSPVLHGDTLIVNWDHAGRSFIAAFDKSTGEQRWKVPRDEVTSWATPIVVESSGRTLVVVSGTKRVRGYDLATGEVVWECGGLSHNIVASPVAGDGMVYAGSSYEKQALVAIRLEGARGDITETDNLVWYRRRSTPYVPSPLLYGDSLYFLHHYQGFLTRVDAKTGEEPHRPLRLEGIEDVYASPVGAADHVYITDRSGVTAVLSHSAPPRLLARNRLEDSFSASLAVVGRELFLRGERFLYCISEEQSAK